MRVPLGERRVDLGQVLRPADTGGDQRGRAYVRGNQLRVVASAGHRAGVARRQEKRLEHSRLETIANTDADVRVALVLPDEIVLVSLEEHAGNGGAPVLSPRLRILGLRVHA